MPAARTAQSRWCFYCCMEYKERMKILTPPNRSAPMISRPMPFFTFLLALAVVVPTGTHAQIIRDPAVKTGDAAEPGTALETGKQAQAEFERFRREHLPSARSGPPGQCDETVGRFCYWYSEKETVPHEPPTIGVRREALNAILDTLALRDPADRWISAQRVRYLTESMRFGDALKAARECGTGGWWCDILVGFSLHMLGEYRSADSVYASALTKMLPRDRCAWRDISLLIDDDTKQQYRRMPCGDRARDAFEDRAWLLSKTLYAMKGNDSRTEWYARMTMALMMQDSATPNQFNFDDDERELMLRFGWDRAWATTRSSDPRTRQITMSIVGMEPIPAYRIVPPGFVLNNPPLSDSTNWRLQLPPVIARYAPPYAKTLKALEHQKAVFKRGDSAMVIMAYDARVTKELKDQKVTASLVIVPADAKRAYSVIVKDAPATGVLTAKAPWGPVLMSAELTAPEKNAVARARYGVSPPFAVGTRVTLSDLLFYKPYGSFPNSAEEAAPHAHPTERLLANDKLGVYWEAYGTDPNGEKMNISLTVVQEVEESGFLRRQAKALKLSRESTPVSITVQDLSARGQNMSQRALELDIRTLKPGSYIVQLEIEVAGQYIVRADHRIEIVNP